MKDVLGEGSKTSRIVLLGEAPGSTELAYGRPFVGKGGKLLFSTLEELGIKRGECYITNVVKQFIPSPKKSDYDPGLMEELKSCTGKDIIVAIGDHAAKFLLPGERTGTTKLNGRIFWSDVLACKVLVVIHPAFVLRQPRRYSSFKRALMKLVVPQEDENEFPYDVNNYDALNALGDIIVEDTEFTDKLWCIGLYDGTGKVHIYTSILPEVEETIRHKHLVFQNAAYDLKKLYLLTGRWFVPGDDTMLMVHSCDETLRSVDGKGGYGLGNLATQFLGAKTYKGEIDWSNPQPAFDDGTMFSYLARDCVYTWRLRRMFKERPECGANSPYRRIIIPYILPICRMELQGCKLDIPLAKKLYVKMQHKADLAAARLRDMSGRPADVFEDRFVGMQFKLKKVVKKSVYGFLPFSSPFPGVVLMPYLEKVSREKKKRVKIEAAYNPNSSVDNLKFFKQRYGKFIEHADAEFLESKKETDRFALYLWIYRKRNKLATFLKDYIAKGEDAGLHTNYLQHGTVGGRLSSAEPNLQNVTGKLRGIFVPPSSEYAFLGFDYSQLEYRVIVALLKDENLQQLLDKGHDIHTITASFKYNKSLSESFTKPERRKGKEINFGVMYGMTDTELAKRLSMSVRDAVAFKAKHFGELLKRKEAIIQRILSSKMAITPFGRRRRFSPVDDKRDIIKQGFNFLIQATAADIANTSLILIDKWFEETGYGWVVLTVHDEILSCVKKDKVEECQAKIEEIMTRKFMLGGREYSFPVEGEVIERWK